jgi:RimJ/RimL family protein N-acetyltransferase
MITIQKPFPIQYVPRIWAWTEQFRDRISDDFAARSVEDLVAGFQAKQSAGVETWAVYLDGQVGGVVSVSYGHPAIAETGSVFRADFWRDEKLVVEALRMVYGRVFSEHPEVEKLYSAAIKFQRIPMVGVLRALGGGRAGVLPRHTKRGGKWVDMVGLELFRDKFAGGVG